MLNERDLPSCPNGRSCKGMLLNPQNNPRPLPSLISPESYERFVSNRAETGQVQQIDPCRCILCLLFNQSAAVAQTFSPDSLHLDPHPSGPVYYFNVKLLPDVGVPEVCVDRLPVRTSPSISLPCLKSPDHPQVIDKKRSKGVVVVNSDRVQRSSKVDSERIRRPAKVDRCDRRDDAHGRDRRRSFESSAGTHEKSLVRDSIKNTSVLGSCPTHDKKDKRRAWKNDRRPTNREVVHAKTSNKILSIGGSAGEVHSHALKRGREEDRTPTAKRSRSSRDESTRACKTKILSVLKIPQPQPKAEEARASTAKKSTLCSRVQVTPQSRTIKSIKKTLEPLTVPEEEEEERASTFAAVTPEPEEDEEISSPVKSSRSADDGLTETQEVEIKSAVARPEPQLAPEEDEEVSGLDVILDAIDSLELLRRPLEEEKETTSAVMRTQPAGNESTEIQKVALELHPTPEKKKNKEEWEEEIATRTWCTRDEAETRQATLVLQLTVSGREQEEIVSTATRTLPTRDEAAEAEAETQTVGHELSLICEEDSSSTVTKSQTSEIADTLDFMPENPAVRIVSASTGLHTQVASGEAATTAIREQAPFERFDNHVVDDTTLDEHLASSNPTVYYDTEPCSNPSVAAATKLVPTLSLEALPQADETAISLCNQYELEGGGCRQHDVSSSRGPVNTIANNLASCHELKNLGDWDLKLDANDPFKKEVNAHVQQIIKGVKNPGIQELQQGFWDHILVGTRPRPKTEAMFAPDVYLPKLFDVTLAPYTFHWCCFVLKKQIILAMWCIVTKRVSKVCTLIDNTLRSFTTSAEFRKMVFYLCRWFEAQYVSQSGRQLKVVLDCKTSEGSTLAHFMALLASKMGMEETTLHLQQNRGGRDDMNYAVNMRHVNSVLNYSNTTTGDLINISREFTNYYETETDVGLVNLRTNTECFSFI
ncbi:hypothetical protein D9C73_000054 [Collichthys lucidus]|uniref:Uncharacterized protein n=1 Tax=Collichthys lucidus TaxID=240159 RepID=A0A4U5TXI6_COLLU|nr:hypothetical protein D9C73_000054 [Collichthys lucidus]